MTNEWLREAASVAEDSYQSANMITERCLFAEQMNEKLRKELKNLEAEHLGTCTTNSMVLENALRLQKTHEENQCIRQIADDAKINSLTIQLDKVDKLHNVKKNENRDLVCDIVTQLEGYQSTIKLLKTDSLNLRSSIKLLETKLSVTRARCMKNKKSFTDALSAISNENKITFVKLKKMFYDLKSATDASNLRAEEEIVRAMYLARENTNMKLELFEFRRNSETNY